MWGGWVPSSDNWIGGVPVGPSLAEFTNPADTVMITDSGRWPGTPECNALTLEGIYSLCGPWKGYSYPYVYPPLSNPWSAPLPLHQRMTNVTFVDGHAKPMKIEALIDPVNLFQRKR
jgi:prepilin-type processing-associated H-X9-DG protein